MYDEAFTEVSTYNRQTHNLAPLIEFSLSGKTIVESGLDISLSSAIDKFDDVRHIFNLPTVNADGFYRDRHIHDVNFGEYQLFNNVNERRAALYSPIVINLDIRDNVVVSEDEVRRTLLRRHYRETEESPARRGQFRRYAEKRAEIFFPHNVYPFGVIGLRPSAADGGATTELVGLSSGGLSGRVGNTLEGITQIMYDFFGCTDAMVLDEGYDVFFIRNPNPGNHYQFTNEQLLARVLSFTKQRADMDAEDASRLSNDYIFGSRMEEWPLNVEHFSELSEDFKASKASDFSDIMMVTPNRSQMRSVLIFAVREESLSDETRKPTQSPEI